MEDDAYYLPNYVTNRVYVHPGEKGAYVTLVDEHSEEEITLGEIEISDRTRIALKAFFVKDRQDYNSFQIVKLQYHATHGWRESGSVRVSGAGAAKIREFSELMSLINPNGLSGRTDISLDNVSFSTLNSILASQSGEELLEKISKSPNLKRDIFAIEEKTVALEQYRAMLKDSLPESAWQSFFEENEWIFGLGLRHVFLEKVSKKLEAVTVGPSFDQPGKRSDGFMKTKAQVSQYIFVEIKKPTTQILKPDAYRNGAYAISDELGGALAQVQKTIFDFAKNRLGMMLKTRKVT